MHHTSGNPWDEYIRIANAAHEDLDVFVGAWRSAYAAGYRGHLPTKVHHRLLEGGMSEQEISLYSLQKGCPSHTISAIPSTRFVLQAPAIDNPPYVPMTSYKNQELSPERYHDYLLRLTFRPFGNPSAGWELKRRLGELHDIQVNVHDYSHASPRLLRNFWPEVKRAIVTHASNLIGSDFVSEREQKYSGNAYA